MVNEDFPSRHDQSLWDEVPPNWHCQDPIDGVAMCYDTTLFVLRGPKDKIKRATVVRTRNSGTIDTHSFVVHGLKLPPITYLVREGGKIELTDVHDCLPDASLDGRHYIEVKQDAVAQAGILHTLINHAPVPVYVSLEWRARPNQPHPDSVQTLLIRGKPQRIAQERTALTFNWRGAELQKVDLYAPWPIIA